MNTAATLDMVWQDIYSGFRHIGHTNTAAFLEYNRQHIRDVWTMLRDGVAFYIFATSGRAFGFVGPDTPEYCSHIENVFWNKETGAEEPPVIAITHGGRG